jgi:nesprin-1
MKKSLNAWRRKKNHADLCIFLSLSAFSDEPEVNTGVLARSYRFLGRVVRAAVPIQAMMLLLLGVSSIVPLEQDELVCTVQNNLQRSFEPMLRWSNGPPPI